MIVVTYEVFIKNPETYLDLAYHGSNIFVVDSYGNEFKITLQKK